MASDMYITDPQRMASSCAEHPAIASTLTHDAVCPLCPRYYNPNSGITLVISPIIEPETGELDYIVHQLIVLEHGRILDVGDDESSRPTTATTSVGSSSPSSPSTRFSPTQLQTPHLDVSLGFGDRMGDVGDELKGWESGLLDNDDEGQGEEPEREREKVDGAEDEGNGSGEGEGEGIYERSSQNGGKIRDLPGGDNNGRDEDKGGVGCDYGIGRGHGMYMVGYEHGAQREWK